MDENLAPSISGYNGLAIWVTRLHNNPRRRCRCRETWMPADRAQRPLRLANRRADPRSPRCLVAVRVSARRSVATAPVFVKGLQGFRFADLPGLEWDLFETTSLELAGGLAIVEEFRCQIANAFRANLTRTSVAIFRSCTDTCSLCACPTSGSDGPKMTIGRPSPAKYRASLDCR